MSKSDDPLDDSISVVKTATRDTLTKKSKLTYQIGTLPDGEVYVRIHDLRHSYASMLVNSGRSLYEVQQILGHSNPKVTQRFSHLSTATLQDAAGSAAERISEALKKAS
jgi:site-specific recombinase XerD